MLVARLARQDHDELQNQIGPRDTHGFGYVGAYVCASKRKCDARRSVGSVSSNSWGVGDLRPALRETEIVLALNKRHPKSSERVQPGSLPFLRVTGGTAPTAGDYGVTSVVSAIRDHMATIPERGCATLPNARSGELVRVQLAQVLETLTAYTSRMRLYSYLECSCPRSE